MTSAPRGYSGKTGAGRAKARPKAVRDVESVECPARPAGGWHFLTNRGAATLCRFCEVEWRTLDAELRPR